MDEKILVSVNNIEKELNKLLSGFGLNLEFDSSNGNFDCKYFYLHTEDLYSDLIKIFRYNEEKANEIINEIVDKDIDSSENVVHVSFETEHILRYIKVSQNLHIDMTKYDYSYFENDLFLIFSI